MQAVHGDIDVGDIGIHTTQSAQGILPVGIGEVPGEGYLHLLFPTLRLDGEGSGALVGSYIIDVAFARESLHGEGVQTRLESSDVLCGNGEAKLRLRILGALVEDHLIRGGIVDSFPGNGDRGGLAFHHGHGLYHGLGRSQHLVQGQHILAPGQFGEGNGTVGIEINCTLAFHLGDNHFLHTGGRSGHATLHFNAVVVQQGDHHAGAGLGTVCNQQVHGTGSVNLKCGIAHGRNALAGKRRSAQEVDSAIGIHRSGLGTHEQELIAHAAVLHLTGKEAGILEVPGVGLGNYVLGEVLGFLHIGNPPLGSTHLTFDEVLGGQLEEVTLGVVARIHVHHLETGLGGRKLLEEVLAVGIAVVAGSVQRRKNGVGVILEQLGFVHNSFIRLAAVFPQEEVVLQGHLVGNTHGKDAAVVTIVNGGDVLHGVVLEDNLANLDGVGGVDTEQGTDTVVHGVVDESDFIDFRGFTDIERIAAGTRNAVHVAGVEGEALNLHDIVVVAIEETGQEVGDFAVHELDAANHGAATGVLHDTGTGCTVELDVLEVQVGVCLGQVGGEFHLTGNHGLLAVRAQFAHQGQAGNGLGRTHGVRRIAVCQIVFTTVDDRGLEAGLVGNRRSLTLLGLGPGVTGATGCTHVEEGNLVLGRGFQASDGGGSGRLLCGGKFFRHHFTALHRNGAELGHFLVVIGVLAPGQGNGVFRAAGDFQEQVVLYSVGLDAAVVHRQVGQGSLNGDSLFVHAIGLYGEPVFLVGREADDDRDLVRFQIPGVFKLGHFLIGVHREEVSVGVLVHVPAKGDMVTGGYVYAGAQVLRLQATLQGEFSDFLELLLGAAGEHGQ